MQNLIENAYVHGSGDNPCLNIKVRKINSHFVKFTISDNGMGFSEEVGGQDF